MADSIVYDGKVVNYVVSNIKNFSNQFSPLSENIKSATNMITSARGFQQYVGGISSDTFSSDIIKCGEDVNNIVNSIRQKQVEILSFADDKDAINEFLDSLSNQEYKSLDLSSIDDYISTGRKVGNAFKGVGASNLAALFGLAEGIGDFLETGADLIRLGQTGVASIFTGLYDLVTGSETTKEMWEQTKAAVSEKKVESIFNNIYDNTQVGQFIKENAYGFDTVRGVSKGLGYTAGVLALTAVTGGLAAGGIGAAGSISAGQLGIVGGLFGFSNGTEQAWSDGASTGKGLLYGAASGAWEGLQWYAGGKINQIGGLGDKVASGIFKGASSGVGTRIAMDTVDSGLEGFVQPALTMIYKDYGDGTFVDKYKTAFQEFGGWKNVATQAAIGAVASAVGEYSGARSMLKSAEGTDIDYESYSKTVTQSARPSVLDDAEKMFRNSYVDSSAAKSVKQAQLDLDNYRRVNNINVNSPNRVIGDAEKALMQNVENAKKANISASAKGASGARKVSVEAAQADLDNYRKINNINPNDTNRVIGDAEKALMDKVDEAKASQVFKSKNKTNVDADTSTKTNTAADTSKKTNAASDTSTKANTDANAKKNATVNEGTTRNRSKGIEGELEDVYRKNYPNVSDADIEARVSKVFAGEAAISGKELSTMQEFLYKNCNGDLSKAKDVFNKNFVKNNDGSYSFDPRRASASAQGVGTSSGAARQYRNTSELIKDVENPLNAETVKKVDSMFQKNPYAKYDDLVVLNSKSAKIDPDINVERAFYDRFSTKNGYDIYEQYDYFYHVRSNSDPFKGNISSRIYLNVGDYSDAYKFAMQFANECENSGMEFYFKTGRTANGRILENLTKYRDDTIIIYCPKEQLANYTNAVNKAIKKTGITLEEPPLLSGRIKGTKIGIGDEPVIYNMNNPSSRTSYNGLRMKVLSSAYNYVNNNYQRYGIVKGSAQYYQFLMNVIIEKGRKYGIDPNNFCFEV